MRIGWPNSTSPALKTEQPVDDADPPAGRVEGDLAAQRDLADVSSLCAAGALAALHPGSRGCRPLRHDAGRRRGDGRPERRARGGRRQAPRSSRGEGSAPPARTSSGSESVRPAARVLAKAIVSSIGESVSASFSRSPARRVARSSRSSARARAVEAGPSPARPGHRHQVGVERREALGGRARDDGIDLDFHAEQRREVRVGVEESVAYRSGDPIEHHAHADRHRHRPQRRRVETQRAERVLGADPLLAQDALHPLPEDRVRQQVRRAHHEHAAARLVERARAGCA